MILQKHSLFNVVGNTDRIIAYCLIKTNNAVRLTRESLRNRKAIYSMYIQYVKYIIQTQVLFNYDNIYAISYNRMMQQTFLIRHGYPLGSKKDRSPYYQPDLFSDPVPHDVLLTIRFDNQ